MSAARFPNGCEDRRTVDDPPHEAPTGSEPREGGEDALRLVAGETMICT